MTLLTCDHFDQLSRNGRLQAAVRGTPDEIDFFPVVKLTTPCGPAVWLLTELDDDGDTAFGLCDLGMGCPELGSVSLAEIETTCFRFGLSTEWDRSFTATAPLSVYAEAARRAGRIVDPLPSEGGGA